MDKQRRKELLAAYKQMKTKMGIFQIKNLQNGKVYIGPCNNLKSRWLTIKGQLETGRFANAALQKEWNELGPEAFEYSVLEEKEIEEQTDVSWELKQMLKKWMQALQPYGEKGYHKKKD